MDIESWFLVLVVAACCAARGLRHWLGLCSSAIERAHSMTAADDGSFSQSLAALNSGLASDQVEPADSAVETATREEQIVAS